MLSKPENAVVEYFERNNEWDTRPV